MIAPKKYLAHYALALTTWRYLYESAMSLLPPANPARTDLEPIETVVTMTQIARKLGVSSSTVSQELIRLRNGGWISLGAERGHYRLGSRVGARIALLADVQAEEATGVGHLVMDQVLGGGQPEVATPGVPSATSNDDGFAPRGAARKWER